MQERGTAAGREPTTVIVERTVVTGHEDDFRELAEAITDAARQHPGFLGWGLLRSAPNSQDWNIVYRFDTTEHLDNWEASPDRIRLLTSGADFMRTVSERRIQEIDEWSEPPTTSTGPPPRWKTFLMTATVILILQLTITYALSPLIGTWPLVVRSITVVLPVVAIMTWIVMPRLSKRLAGWLYGTRT